MYPWGHCEHVTKSHSIRSGVAPAASRCLEAAAASRLSTGPAMAAEVADAAAVASVAAIALIGRGDVESRKPLRMVNLVSRKRGLGAQQRGLSAQQRGQGLRARAAESTTSSSFAS